MAVTQNLGWSRDITYAAQPEQADACHYYSIIIKA